MAINAQTAKVAIAALVLSAGGFLGIAFHEGYTEKAVIPIPGDVPTIGFGTTEGVKMGDTITPTVALQRALRDVQKFESAIKQCVHVPLAQHEYDVYVSFAYNVGSGAFCSSTLVRKLNAGDYTGACNELPRWVYAGGRVVQGLVNRREKERAQCLGLSQ
jgi:lysozyme